MTDEPKPELLQKSDEARQLLSVLGRDNFEFRAFPDATAGISTGSAAPFQRRVGTFDEHMHELRKLNDQGFGIFVQINTADGNGFRATNINGAPCVFADFDGAPLANLERLQIKPHLVIETSPGKYHAYWRVADIPLSDFKTLQQRVARLFESDQKIVDLPRVMRLPGFLHMKDPAHPFRSHPIEAVDAPPIPYSVFTDALSKAELARGIEAKPSPETNAVVAGKHAASIDKSKSAIDFLIRKQLIDTADYGGWIELAFALKHSHGEEGFDLWHAISSCSEGYEGEDDCRAKWRSIDDNCERPLTMASYFALAKDHGWKKPKQSGGSDDDDDSDPAAAIVARDIAIKRGDKFWMDLQGIPHVTFKKRLSDEIVREIHVPIDGLTYREDLIARYTSAKPKKVLSKEQLNSAINLLQHKAKEGQKYPTHLRTGWHDGAVYIELGRPDGKVVRVDKDSYVIVYASPIRFVYRGEGNGELPLPEAGGTLAVFAKHYNMKPSDTIRVVAFQIAALIGIPSYAILLLLGGQGTGKSTIGDMVLSLTDPTSERKNGRTSFSTDEKNLFVKAMRAHVLFFDNISVVDQSSSDALCRIVTGGALSLRSLYTNAEEFKLSAIRPVIVTCIGTPTARGDFLDRCIMVTAQTVTKRRTEEIIWREFSVDRPQMFGFILTAISASIRNADMVQQEIENGNISVPRLADFAAAVEGAAECLGLTLGEFSEMEKRDQEGMQAEAALGNDFIEALAYHVGKDSFETLEATGSELSRMLKPYEPSRHWPSANQVSRVFTRNEAGLKALGIGVEVIPARGHANVLRFQISRLQNFSPIGTAQPRNPF